MRKVILELTIKVIVNLKEDETVEEFIDDI